MEAKLGVSRIRTENQGIMSPDCIKRKTLPDNDLDKTTTSNPIENCTSLNDTSPPVSHDLSELLESWDKLPAPLRDAIRVILQAGR